MVRFVLTCKFELNTAILDFDRFEVSKNPIFSQLMPETSNGGFRASCAECSLTFKFELITAILNLERLKVSKNAIFYNLSRRP